MKLLKRLSLIVILLNALSLCFVAQADEKTWIDLNFDSVQPGGPPSTATFDPAKVNHSLETTSVTDGNKLQVVNDAPGFPGKALRFIKDSQEPRTPRAIFVNSPGLLKSGKVRFTWEADIDSFVGSDKFPGFEALLAFVLMDGAGTPFFNLYYLIDANKSGGAFGCGGQKQGSWTIGTKQKFEVMLDLDAKTAQVTVDGTPIGAEQKITAVDGVRVVQFSDGAGLAYYGSKFTATVAHFKMTSL